MHSHQKVSGTFFKWTLIWSPPPSENFWVLPNCTLPPLSTLFTKYFTGRYCRIVQIEDTVCILSLMTGIYNE